MRPIHFAVDPNRDNNVGPWGIDLQKIRMYVVNDTLKDFPNLYMSTMYGRTKKVMGDKILDVGERNISYILYVVNTPA